MPTVIQQLSTCQLYLLRINSPDYILCAYSFADAGVLYNFTIRPVNEIGQGESASVLAFSKPSMTILYTKDLYEL